MVVNSVLPNLLNVAQIVNIVSPQQQNGQIGQKSNAEGTVVL